MKKSVVDYSWYEIHQRMSVLEWKHQQEGLILNWRTKPLRHDLYISGVGNSGWEHAAMLVFMNPDNYVKEKYLTKKLLLCR